MNLRALIILSLSDVKMTVCFINPTLNDKSHVNHLCSLFVDLSPYEVDFIQERQEEEREKFTFCYIDAASHKKTQIMVTMTMLNASIQLNYR